MPVVKDALLIVIVIFVSFFWQISCAYSQSIVNAHKERSLDKGNSSFLAIDRSRNMLSHAQKWISDANANITQLKYPTTLVELYSSIGFSQFWENDRTIQDFINQLRIISLSQTNKELTARYHLLIQLQPQQNWQQYDVVATDTLLIYLSFIEQLQGKRKMWLFGEKVPSQLPTPSQVSIEDILMNYENNQFNQFIVSLKPQLSGYNQLVASINRLESHPTLRWPVFSFHGKVGPGSKIKYMPSLITVLERLGDLSPLEAKH